MKNSMQTIMTIFKDYGGTGYYTILFVLSLIYLGFTEEDRRVRTILVYIPAVMLFLFRRKVGLRQRMLIAQALSLEDMESVVRIQKLVIGGSLGVQALGALVLCLRFWPEFGLGTAVKWGLFHSISAFCNAGFDIFGYNDSVMHFNSDPVIMFTLMALIVIGGLGFFVWEELIRIKRFSKFSVYTKLVLVTTSALILGGAGLFLLLEWNNPGTLQPMSWGDKLLNSLFQSVTLRTAGFAGIDQGQLTDGSKAISCLLMLIGGSSGSTAGGLKTVTIVVLLLFVGNRIRGRETVNVYRRQIPKNKVLDAMTIVAIVAGLCMVGAVVITATSPVSFIDSFYESASALGTAGLTAGATALLSIPAKVMIIAFMYFGRVGVLTLSMGFLLGDKAQQRFSYAETNLLIG